MITFFVVIDHFAQYEHVNGTKGVLRPLNYMSKYVKFIVIMAKNRFH